MSFAEDLQLFHRSTGGFKFVFQNKHHRSYEIYVEATQKFLRPPGAKLKTQGQKKTPSSQEGPQWKSTATGASTCCPDSVVTKLQSGETLKNTSHGTRTRTSLHPGIVPASGTTVCRGRGLGVRAGGWRGVKVVGERFKVGGWNVNIPPSWGSSVKRCGNAMRLWCAVPRSLPPPPWSGRWRRGLRNKGSLVSSSHLGTAVRAARGRESFQDDGWEEEMIQIQDLFHKEAVELQGQMEGKAGKSNDFVHLFEGVKKERRKEKIKGSHKSASNYLLRQVSRMSKSHFPVIPTEVKQRDPSELHSLGAICHFSSTLPQTSPSSWRFFCSFFWSGTCWNFPRIPETR